jgi:uncharacterized protein (DUF433 family)/predicted nuclease of predicted toxin-antitoxin system
MSNINYQDIITIEAGKRSGKPCIRGLRITVYDILEYFASGMTQDEILEDFDYLTKEDIQACFAYAADREKHTRYQFVKLLFDKNLPPPKLVAILSKENPDSKHVARVGLGSESDDEVWEYAKDNGFILVSKGSDFCDKSTLYGHPPKVIWIRRSNCPNRKTCWFLFSDGTPNTFYPVQN